VNHRTRQPLPYPPYTAYCTIHCLGAAQTFAAEFSSASPQSSAR
jgi:hypothetical protein